MSSASSTLLENHIFDFDDSSIRSSAAHVYIRRLFDVLQLSIARHDAVRARRAWAILIRCDEVKWKPLWRLAVQVLEMDDLAAGGDDMQTIRFLGDLKWDAEAESVLRELVLHRLRSGQIRQTLDILRIQLHDFPHRDNAVLHVYAGLVCIALAQPEVSDGSLDYDADELRKARFYLKRALVLDPKNELTTSLLNKIKELDPRERDPEKSPEPTEELLTLEEQLSAADDGSRKKARRT